MCPQGCAFALKIKMRCDANAKIFQNHFAMQCDISTLFFEINDL